MASHNYGCCLITYYYYLCVNIIFKIMMYASACVINLVCAMTWTYMKGYTQRFFNTRGLFNKDKTSFWNFSVWDFRNDILY
jgi:hypothetical protein